MGYCPRPNRVWTQSQQGLVKTLAPREKQMTRHLILAFQGTKAEINSDPRNSLDIYPAPAFPLLHEHELSPHGRLATWQAFCPDR